MHHDDRMGTRSGLGWLGGLGALFVVAACASPRPASQVRVDIDAQPRVRGLTTELVIRVSGGHDGEAFTEVAEATTVRAPITWPYDVTVAPAGADATRLFELEATAYDSGHRLVSQARLRGGYVRGEARHVTLTLEDACVGVSCAAGLACRAGRCVPIETPETDGGVPDGGDGGVTPPCQRAADCNDGNNCNGIEACRDGTCIAGAPLDCDDHVGCTTDTCDGQQCVHTPDATLCPGAGATCDPVNDCQLPTCSATNCASDGCRTASCSGTTCVRTFACAAGQTCCGTSCVPAGCADALPCTTDFCGTSGTCEHVPHGGACDDGDVCTGDGVCNARDGTCGAGAALPCTDGNPCTTDTCDPATGCRSTANTDPCDDDNPCTDGDVCAGGACQPGTRNPCDDGVACTSDQCSRVTGACTNAPNDSLCTSPATCDAHAGCQVSGACSAATCQPTPGSCETATCVGTTCMRANRCSTGQMCCGGACVPDGCDDGNVCTDDVCNAGMARCDHTGTTDPARACNDGSNCTVNDRCVGATCSGVLDCNDGNECTDDSCGGTECLHDPSLFDTACGASFGCVRQHCDGAGSCVGYDCAGFEVCCNERCVPRGDC